MGVNLRDLFPAHRVPEGWYAGKRVAVDGHNLAFRYLTSIRGRDGDVLRNRDGRPIGHMIGFSNLVRHLRERGAEPVIVWDGEVHPRKRATVEERIARRVEAALNAEDAIAAGDVPGYRKWSRQAVYLDGAMIRDCTRLLESFGVAVVRADHDAERYAAALCKAGFAHAVATEDYDALVAGAPTVLRKAGSAEPFLHELSDAAAHGLDGRTLRWVAILCGTDWHPGVKGLGAKTAVRLLQEHPDLRALVAEAQSGGGATRYHRLLRESGLTLEEFDALDAYVAQLPTVQEPRPARPNPAQAAAVADEWGLERSRTLAAFC